MTIPKKNKSNSSTLNSLAIILGSLIISFGILGVSGGFSTIWDKVSNLIPRSAKYQKVKNLDDNLDLVKVIESQPKISYGKGKYVLIETGDLDCVNCANFHTSSDKNTPSTYSQIFDKYIKNGKVDYLWIDNQGLGDIKKHTAIYCVAEQNSKKTFEFKDKLYAEHGKGFDINTIKNIVKPLNINTTDLENCINSDKYKNRVEKLSSFAESLGNTATPVFYLYELQDTEFINTQGKSENRKTAKELEVFKGNQIFELFDSGIEDAIR